MSVTVTFDKPLSGLKVGDVAKATIFLNGAPLTGGDIRWAYSTPNIVECTLIPGGTGGTVAQLTATHAGTTDLICIVNGTQMSPVMHATVAAVVPPPPPVMSIEPTVARLTVGQSVQINAKRNGIVAVSGILWSAGPALTITPLTPGSGQAMLSGNVAGGAAVKATDSPSGASATMAVAVDPKPVPVPRPAPARGWKHRRPHITLLDTDFRYNWKKWTSGGPTPEEVLYANRFDISISGDAARHARMKLANPDHHFIPYTLQWTTLQNGDNTVTEFAPWNHRWALLNGLTPEREEAMYLHVGGGIGTPATRVTLPIWGSPRFVLDPTNPDARAVTIARYKEMAAVPPRDGLFADEFGSGGMTPAYKLAAGSNAVLLGKYEDAETSLLSDIADAIAPKQFIINTASYWFGWDMDCAKAARGTHLEQTNNPLVLELWSMWWPFIDSLLAAGALVNMVPPYQFGEYESQHDAQPVPSPAPLGALALSAAVETQMTVRPERWAGHPVRESAGVIPPALRKKKPGLVARVIAKVKSMLGLGAPVGNYMDTTRGKLCEVASYFMCVTDPALLALSIENGDWLIYTPTQNYVVQIDAEIGAPIEGRHLVPQPPGAPRGHTYSRRFGNGLVMVNLIPDRLPRDYGYSGATTYTLPTDRTYWRVMNDGSLQSPRATVQLRCPEAAIFVCTGPLSDLR